MRISNVDDHDALSVGRAQTFKAALLVKLRSNIQGSDPFQRQTYQDYLLLDDDQQKSTQTRERRTPLCVLDCVEGEWEPNAFLKIVGAIISWKLVRGLWLFDKESERLVGHVSRCTSLPEEKQPGQIELVWRDDWLCMPSDREIEGKIDGLGEFAPHHMMPTSKISKVSWRQSWGQHFSFSDGAFLSLSAAAKREKYKHQIQKLIGVQLTSRFQKFYHMARDKNLAWSSESQEVKLAGNARNVQVEPLWRGLTAANDDRIGILYLIPRLVTGGADKSTVDLVSRLDQGKYRLHVLSTVPSDNPWHDRVADLEIECLHLPTFLHPDHFLDFVTAFIQAREISVVHVMHSRWAYKHVSILKERIPNLQFLDQIHVDVADPQWNFLALSAVADDYFSIHTVTSQIVRNIFIYEHGIDDSKIEIITTNVDPDGEFNPDKYEKGAWRKEVGINPDVPIVLFLGRFADQKRPAVYLDVAEMVLKVTDNVNFVMMGEGPLEEDMRKRIVSSELLSRHVRIFPAMPKIGPVLRDADILFQPSQFEGLAYVSYEAMAMHLPQVFSNVGAQNELIDDETGVLVNVGPDEVNQMANALIVMLGDKEKRKAMGERAREKVVKHYHIDRLTARYSHIYFALHKKYEQQIQSVNAHSTFK